VKIPKETHRVRKGDRETQGFSIAVLLYIRLETSDIEEEMMLCTLFFAKKSWK
jgi:hypothetical protein